VRVTNIAWVRVHQFKKVPEAKVAFTAAASVNSPYKQPAQDKIKTLPAGAAVRQRKPS